MTRTLAGHISLGCTIVLLVTGAAQAQSSTAATPSSSTSSATTSQPSDQPPPTAREAFWEPIGGFEGDTHGTGYGFFGPSYIRPLSSNLAFTARAFGNFLYYDFEDALGTTTSVRSPGLNTAAGVRYMFANNSFAGVHGGPSFKFRRTEINGISIDDDDNDLVLGFNVGGDVYFNPTSHNNIHALVDYGSADEYVWSRLAYKEQITNRGWNRPFSNFLGGEVIAQGNDDIRSMQVGALYELAHGPSSTSVMFRAGIKRSTFEFGDDRTGPYIGFGFYKRLQ